MRSRPLALLLLAAAALGLPGTGLAESNRIVLRVNDRIATLYDYERLKRDQLRSLARFNLSEEERQRRIARVGVDTMRSLFEEMLYLSRADQLDIRVPPSELQEALQRTKESFNIRTEEEYDEALRQSGMTRDDMRTQIENSLRMREVFSREVYSEIQVQEEDLRRYYGAHPDEFKVPAAVKLREVVVLESSGLDASERERLASSLKSAIEAGEAEAALLETETDGRTTGWIDLGWVEAGDLDAQLEEAVAELEVGGVSEPTAARGGLHILQLVERRDEALKEFAEVRDSIEAAERDRRFEKRLAEYVSELEDQAFIVSYPPPDAAGFRSENGSAPSGVDGRDAGESPAGAQATNGG